MFFNLFWLGNHSPNVFLLVEKSMIKLRYEFIDYAENIDVIQQIREVILTSLNKVARS